MGKACCDYRGYGREWLSKSDLKPKTLRKYGIKATVKQINAKCGVAIDGYVMTGGCGHEKRVNCYSIAKLKEEFK